MSKMRTLLVLVLGGTFGPTAWGQTPFVHNLLVVDPQTNIVATDTYQDIPESDQSVTIPAGTAVIMWSIGASSGTLAWCNHVRPVIGTLSPTEGPYVPLQSADTNIGYGSGTWATPVEGGTVTVKLQARRDRPACTDGGAFAHDMSWTLIVFPDTKTGVPAVSTWGLAVMVLLLGIAATVMIRKRVAL